VIITILGFEYVLFISLEIMEDKFYSKDQHSTQHAMENKY